MDDIVSVDSQAVANIKSTPEAHMQHLIIPYVESATLPSYKFLIVDDTGSSRKLVRRMLTRMDHVCAEADDGDTCLSMMGGDMSVPPYDAILMDNTMPRMSGVVATRTLRSMGFVLPIIGITGNVLPDELEEFRSQGADIVLKKPVSYEEIINSVLKVQSSCKDNSSAI